MCAQSSPSTCEDMSVPITNQYLKHLQERCYNIISSPQSKSEYQNNLRKKLYLQDR